MIRILIVGSDPVLTGRITDVLMENEYAVMHAKSSAEAFTAIDETDVHLIVAGSFSGGIQLTEDLRSEGNTVPVIIITDDTSRAEVRRIFRSGADGYMVLPVDVEELGMRIKSLLWRCSVVEEASMRFGNCVLDSATLTLHAPDMEISLRRMEFLLLEKLLSYPGRIFTRNQLMDDLWGYDNESGPRTVDTHIRRLRKKLAGVEDIRITTVRGLGYRAAMPRRLRRSSAAEDEEE